MDKFYVLVIDFMNPSVKRMWLSNDDVRSILECDADTKIYRVNNHQIAELIMEDGPSSVVWHDVPESKLA